MQQAVLPINAMHDHAISRLCAAVNDHDVQSLIDLLASDVIVRSPLTRYICFEGIEQVSDLFRRVFAIIGEMKMYEVVGAGSGTQVIFWKGRVGSTYVEEANLIRMNERGEITEMTVFMRAVPGLLKLASRIAPSLASRHGPIRALFIRLQLTLMWALYSAAEPMVLRLSGAGVPAREPHIDSASRLR
jgi:hypothetical protein